RRSSALRRGAGAAPPVVVARKPKVFDAPGAITRLWERLAASTHAPVWVISASQASPAFWPPVQAQRRLQPSIGWDPVLVTVTWAVKPSSHVPCCTYSTSHSPGCSGRPSPWSARNDAIQASAEFQLIATSLVAYDSMWST